MTAYAKTDACRHCDLRSLCAQHDPAAPRQRPVVTRPLPAGAHLYWAGDEVTALYAVRSGCLKSYAVDADGHERVRGFYHPGDIVALDALHGGRAPSNIQALVGSSVCSAPASALHSDQACHRMLQNAILARLSRELEYGQTLAGDYTAEQRVAHFLLKIADKSPTSCELQLDMGRRDIANHLRLVTETISRVFRRLADNGLIRAERRRIQILDRAGLEQLAAPVRQSPVPGSADPVRLHAQAA